jgi:hypothetical protein
MCYGGQDEEIAICKPYSEFGLNFSSKQQIHRLRQKLHHARSILINTQNTLAAIRIHEDTIARMCNLSTPIHDGFQRELRNMSGELTNYAQTIRKLLSFSSDIRLMVRLLYT